MERYGRAGEEGSRSDPSPEWSAPGGETGVEASMWRLGLRSGGESYPERPDEPDCIYYLRTGACGYGSRCRFNHPRDRGAVMGASRRDAGESIGQPVCQHFMKTGTCKYGASCKYHHPRQGSSSGSTPVMLNYMGYPLRLGEKECSYYMRTGQCKFGATCRFHHPVPPGVQLPSPPPPPVMQVSPMAAQAIYPTVQSPSVPSSQQYEVVMPRPPFLPGSYVQSPYGTMVLPPGMVPYSGWNPYAASVSAIPSTGTQPSVGSGSIYGLAPLSPSAPAYTGPYQSGPSSVSPSSTQKEQLFPQRPGQPECQYFMRTGNCKFGSSCRYHHPLDAVPPITSVILGPTGLPLRPGTPLCTHFAQHGTCRFGPACRFDHSMGSLSYSPSASSLTDMPVAPYPVGSSLGTLAPSSSSSDLRPELISSSSREIVSPKTTTSGSETAPATVSSPTSGPSHPEPPAQTAGVDGSSSLEARTSS
ncbi:PREDICTED: zinc finger CCCH domain-containing protein 58-like isoform X2 [Tarenaya hassleriana]|uniref:zinc finger CCCH domain-containing protein 58-like isoform X2 n=1 Tax=Tarenaya hassleriana TaxID=28532 RepID=UPI00053C5641|nr:PREDICTED: zinc finger CCCH domain-containing protein 58-like isoform X2 [Tarenaya hassleriana]